MAHSADRRRGGRLRRLAVHACRVGVVAALVGLVHAEHSAFLSRRQVADLDTIPLERVRALLPAAAAVGGDSSGVVGGRDLVDDRGERVGTMLRTSPEGDAAIGFSGPSDLLIVCDRDLRVAGVEILSSRDTRDHVTAIERDTSFLRSFAGRPLAELAAGGIRGDAVGGSTLTSLAIAEAISLRLGGRETASRFTTPPTLADLKQVFPTAEKIAVDPGDPAVIRITAAADIPLGWALRTSPAADRIIGYQGPTDAAVVFDAEGKVAGVVVAASFDNEPYVGYVRDDRAFRRIYRGMRIEELAGTDPEQTGIEGVSGATMTSQAVARGIAVAARRQSEKRAHAAPLAAVLATLDGPRLGAIGVILAGIVTAFTRLRGGWFGRLAMPIAVLLYLGFGAGALLSQAQLWGWAQAGVPRGAVVLLVLAVAAVLLPVTTRKNVYCSHLCPHGAAQQLLVRVVKPRRSVPDTLRPWLVALPWVLLVVAILTAVLHLPLNLVDLEPFDAYLPTIAGVAALVIFAASLVASAAVPMAYCRFGCPTGALLDQLRFHGHADRITWRDGLLVGCLVSAALVHWWPR
jgi:hypothetical protein